MPIDDAAAQAALDALISRLPPALAKGVLQGTLVIEGAAKTLAPVGDRPDNDPGQLRRSIQTEGPIPLSAWRFLARTGPTVIYGRQRELGGPIVPRRASILRWWDYGGNPVFAKDVYQRPEPYMKPALMLNRDRAVRLILHPIADVIRSV